MILDAILEQKRPIRKFTYPIHIAGYRSNWGEWDVIRELLSNAIDAENGDWNKVKLSDVADSLTIHNITRPLTINDFYFGFSSQGKGLYTDYNGRFNEGMKLALMVAVREGYKTEVYFDKYVAIPSAIETKDKIKILEIKIFNLDKKIPGTKIIISKIGNNGHELITKNVIFPDDTRILLRTTAGIGSMFYSPQIDETSLVVTKNKLEALTIGGVFVGGMFVSELKDYAWGYNVSPSLIKISEGRNFIDTYDLNSLIKTAMLKIDKKAYWFKIFMSIKNNLPVTESKITPYAPFLSPILGNVKNAILETWTEVFGDKAVVEDPLAREVEYRGGEVIKGIPLLKKLAEYSILPTGADFLQSYAKVDRIIYDLNTLPEIERRAYDIIHEIVSKYVNRPIKLIVYDSIPAKDAAEGFYSRKDDIIGINRPSFKGPEELFDTLEEELVHAIFNTNDMSRNHTDKLRQLSVILLFDDFVIDRINKLKELYSNETLLAAKTS
jgi:hypothetical protein